MVRNFKKSAFTLAEFLIVIGMIGVIAAMTIPVLISNTNSKKFPTQFKKSLSTLKQAATMGIAMYDHNFASVNATCNNGATDNIEDDLTLCGLLNATLAGRIYIEDPFNELIVASGEKYNYSSRDDSWIIGNGDWHGYQLSDGSMFLFMSKNGNCTKSEPCSGIIDVNGTTLPNKQMTDINLSYNNILMPAAYASTAEESRGINRPTKADGVRITDVFPVYFYDSVVVPATAGGYYVLTGSLMSSSPEEQPEQSPDEESPSE